MNRQNETVRHEENLLGTQVRLVRNFADFSFPHTCTPTQKQEIARRIGTIFSALDPALCPPESGKKKCFFAIFETDGVPLLCNRTGELFIAANGENHVTILSQSAGLSPDRAYEKARLYEQAFCEKAAVAFDKEFGYLTARPAEAGTALTVSCVLHLPSLSVCGQIGTVRSKTEKQALKLRGIFGESENSADCLYRLSTLDARLSEKELLGKLTVAALAILRREKELCRSLYIGGGIDFKDNLCRAYGVLLYAEKLTHTEFRKLWSEVLCGVECGLFPRVGVDTLTELWKEALPENLSDFSELSETANKDGLSDLSKKTLLQTPASVDVRRAEITKAALRKDAFRREGESTSATQKQIDEKNTRRQNIPSDRDKGERL